ncbi:MAG: TRAP transporter small permease [Methylobacteriaceae bacterium]|jgi:TRAP-type C4-dicarboxylate transport system permease small subunit|nr:TRAP transporter small permease [Methylobacteriaceae bacterium]
MDNTVLLLLTGATIAVLAAIVLFVPALCPKISKLSLVLATMGLAVVVVCVLYQVFGRYVLNNTPTWAEAFAMVVILFVTMLGTAVGVRDAGHIGMESLLALCPQPYKRWLEIFIHCSVASFGAFMAYGGSFMILQNLDHRIPTLPLPEAANYLPITIGGILICLFSFEHVVALIKGTEVKPSWH